jgi:hypothetical protein
LKKADLTDRVVEALKINGAGLSFFMLPVYLGASSKGPRGERSLLLLAV